MSSNGWQKTTLGKVSQIICGATPSTKVPEYWSGDIKWVTAKDVSESTGYKIYNTERKISKLGFENCSTKMIQKESTVLIARGATMGKSCMLGEDMAINQTCYALIPEKDKIDPYFLFYSIKILNDFFQQIAHGAIFNTVIGSGLRETQISLPSLPAQRRIADILSALDEKIELNRRVNVTLEAMAQAIFKEWFVDFNLPAIGVGADFKSAPTEPTNTLPQGWRVGKLGDVIEIKGGTTPSTKEEKYWNGEYHWATPKDLSNLSSPILLDTERKVTKEGVSQIGSGILPKGTLLLSSRAPIGYLAISNVPISINQGFIAINAKELSNLFMLHWLKENMETIISRANGSTFLEISKTSFKEIELVIPDAQTTNRFEEIVSPIFEQIKNNEQQTATLAAVRDALLPKLMSGEIGVSEINN